MIDFDEAMQVFGEYPRQVFAVTYKYLDPATGLFSETKHVLHKGAVLRGLLLRSDAIEKVEAW